MFDSVDSLEASGFVGFKNIGYLFSNCSDVPYERGNYIIAYLNTGHPKFLESGVGGFFKGKKPNVPIDELESCWVNGTVVVYIGQAGGIRAGKWSNQTLNERVSAYMKFGQGKPVGHWGGRLIWQIQNYKDLVVCWKLLPNKMTDPKQVEKEMIREFKNIYGKWPFANRQG